MKIFIDDSGDFGWKRSGISLFCGLTIADRTLDDTSAKFIAWKRRQPRSAADSELKGKHLSPQQQLSFATSVILESKGLQLTLAGTKTTLFERKTATQYVRNSADILQATSKRAAELGKPALADFYIKMAKWMGQRSPENLMWLLTLVDAIDLSIQHSIVMFADECDDCEFEKIEILIDKSFIRKQRHIEFWGEWLRNALISKSKKKPLFVIREWSSRDHPFNRRYRREKGLLDLSDLFRNHMRFVDSADTLGIQMADICANVCYRFYSGKSKYRPYRLVRSRIRGEGRSEILIGVLNESSTLTDAPEKHVTFYSDEDLAEWVRESQSRFAGIY